MQRTFLLLMIMACVFSAACGGGSGEQDPVGDADQTYADCAVDADCPDGYTCSAAGACIAADSGPTSTACLPGEPSGPVLYVATDGSDDEQRDGSASEPFATITYALDRAQDGTVILVRPGLYSGRVRIRGTFPIGVVVRSEVPYTAQLRNSDTVITGYSDARGCSGITLEGLDIAHTGAGAGALVVHLDAGGTGTVSDITLRNNILHDSYNNDILKINNGIRYITVERNLFYNQTGSDEHIDINSAADIIVQDNIFMNDFAGSGRTNANDTSSYIVVKDSNGEDDRYVGSRDITIRRNIFLNWEGSSGCNFLLLGEDGKAFYEADGVTIENNLMIGNSVNVMRAPFGIKGCRNVVFNNNTIAGDLPSLAFAMRFNLEGDNLINTNIEMHNNIWSDPTGTMGARYTGDANDFSDTPEGEVQDFVLDNNLYYNGANPIPEDGNERINISDDAAAVVADPGLGDQASLIPPRWLPDQERFADDSDSICEVFENLVQRYGLPAGLAVVDQADPLSAPGHDILGNPRGDDPDIGAVEVR